MIFKPLSDFQHLIPWLKCSLYSILLSIESSQVLWIFGIAWRTFYLLKSSSSVRIRTFDLFTHLYNDQIKSFAKTIEDLIRKVIEIYWLRSSNLGEPKRWKNKGKIWWSHVFKCKAQKKIRLWNINILERSYWNEF
jgi:hypothetical protein